MHRLSNGEPTSSWAATIHQAPELASLTQLPPYAFQFFFTNMGVFRARFFALTFCCVLSAILRFGSVLILSNLLTNVQSLTPADVIYFYLPIYAGVITTKEGIDYLIRRYAEAFPLIYMEHLRLRFFKSLFRISNQRLSNLSKERLLLLVTKYTGHVQSFLNDWFWGTSRRLTQFLIALVILYQQSPYILLCNALYMVCFLLFSFKLSARFAELTREYSSTRLDIETEFTSFIHRLNTVTRLGIQDYFVSRYESLIPESWKQFAKVREFHAKRWLIQLSIFNALYIGTLCFGAIQVAQGALPLGFLVLIKYAFDEFWEVLVYIIEYYVQLIAQKEDSKLVSAGFSEIVGERKEGIETKKSLGAWSKLCLSNANAEFHLPGKDKFVRVSIPLLSIQRGEKIGITGESGSGKTTVLNMLLNAIEYQGRYEIDGVDVLGSELAASDVTIVSSFDPLFPLTLRENLLLGRKVDEEKLTRILQGVAAEGLIEKLDVKVGSPDFNLSTGQEQRIRLARGLLSNTSFLLFDEALNGIDLFTKKKILPFLSEFLADKTAVFVSHHDVDLQLAESRYEFVGHELTKVS